MLQYPSITRWQDSRGIGKPCIAFYKYDGSNLRWEWSLKRGFYKYGSRTQLFDQTSEQFGEAIPLFQDLMAKDIANIVTDEYGRTERIIAFTEFFGENSFAGTHVLEDKKHLILFDVSVYKKGFIEPRKFVKMFGACPWTAKVVYEGNMNIPFIEDIRNGKYPVYEGVICKGDGWSAKIKTLEYLERLKNTFPDTWEKLV
jgi:hypothetical protein